MRFFLISFLTCMVFMTGCVSEPRSGPEAGAELIEEIAAAMGGWEALEAIEREELEIRGTAWEPHQARFPGGILELASYETRMLVDYTGPSLRLEFRGERTYPAPGSVGFIEVVDEDVGAVFEYEAAEPDEDEPAPASGVDSEPTPPTGQRMRGSRLAARLRDIDRMPARIPLLARESEAVNRAPDRSVEGTRYEVLEYHDGRNPVEILVNPTTKLPSRALVLETDPLYGDTQNELAFDDWRPTPVPATMGGTSWEVPLPHRRTLYLNGDRFREEEIQSLVINSVFDSETFDIPSAIRSAPERGDRITSEIAVRRAIMGFGPLDGFGSLPEVAPLQDVAPGVWLAGGSSHNSLIVEMSDHLIVIGTPLFEERSIGVIEALNVRFPDKPVRYAVVSHFHADHSGGVRAYAGVGATIVAHESIVPFLEVVLSRPRSIRPDTLVRSGRQPTVEGVGESFELSDGSRTVGLWTVPNEHVGGMLIAHIPDVRVAFVSDLYSPPNPVDPSDANAMAFFEAIRERNLDVETVVGAHGSTGPFSALANTMGAGATEAN